MKWLISYEYIAVFYHKNRPTTMVGPTPILTLADQHPAKLVAEMEAAFAAVRNGEGERQGDMFQRLLYAVEVPDGTLTEEEADSFS